MKGRRDEGVLQAPDLTIVGGQPPRRRRPWKVRIPGGVELVLHKASKEPSFAEALVTDRAKALASCGVPLTETERAALDAAPNEVLAAMIAGLRDRERSPSPTMRWITAAAASLAAGTTDCGDVPVYGGPDAGVDVVWGPDAGMDVYIGPGVDAGIPPDQWSPPPYDAGDASEEAASADADNDAADADNDAGADAGIDADDADVPDSGRAD